MYRLVVAEPYGVQIVVVKTHQWFIGMLLVTLMALTRGHHFSAVNYLPSASAAVFLLAGFYITSKLMFLLLLLTAALLDYIAITFGGVSSACVTPAYAMLLPAYGSLWLAGNWYAKHHQFNWRTLPRLTMAVVVATAIYTLFSGGGFYFFSGVFPAPTWAEYSQRFSTYFPDYLAAVAFYVSIAGVFHCMLLLLYQSKIDAEKSHVD